MKLVSNHNHVAFGESSLPSNELSSTRSRKQSILIVTHLYPNLTTPFLGTFVAQQLQHLKARYTIVVLTTRDVSFTKRRGLQQPQYEFRDGIHVYSLPHWPYWLSGLALIGRRSRRFHDFTLAADKLFISRRIQAFSRQLHKRYDFSLVHGHEIYVGDECASIGRILGIPSVFTLHGLYWYHRRSFGDGVVRRAIADMNAADRLIAVSRISAESYKKQGVRQDFRIIPDGISPQISRINRVPISPDISAFVRNRFLLLTVGFFVPEKRIELSIRTVARLHRNGRNDTALIIIGKGPLEGDYRKVIAREGLSDAVRIVGEVPPSNMPGYFSATDVLIHPSIVESFSMVCLEAMSYGKPVVCTSNIGLTEHLTPGRDAMVVPPDDPEALYRAVLELIQRPSLCRILGQRAKRKANDLVWSRQVHKIERVYREVLSSPRDHAT